MIAGEGRDLCAARRPMQSRRVKCRESAGRGTGPEIVRAIGSLLACEGTYKRVYFVLDRLRQRGVVRREEE